MSTSTTDQIAQRLRSLRNQIQTTAGQAQTKAEKHPGRTAIIAAIVVLIVGAAIWYFAYYLPDHKKTEDRKHAAKSIAQLVGQRGVAGADCASLGPDYEGQCKLDKRNKMASGDCDELDGCDRKVCEELFEDGVYPRPMTYKNVPRDQYLIPTDFSKHYTEGWKKPENVGPLMGKEQQNSTHGWASGDFAEMGDEFGDVSDYPEPLGDPYSLLKQKTGMYDGADPVKSGPAATQFPQRQNWGQTGLHEFGDPQGFQTFSGQ